MQQYPGSGIRPLILVLMFLALSSCGGGGGGGAGGGNTNSPNSWTAGVFEPSATFEAKCAAPRSGSSQVTGQPFPDMQGTGTDERNWLRSWTHELYLWYREVPDLNPANYATLDYFDQLKTSAVTASGQPKDKFHFTFSTAQWEAISQSGTEAGYGVQWEIVSAVPPRRATVAYIEPAAPASTLAASLTRGTDVLAVDGVDVDTDTSAGIDQLNAGLFPAAPGEQHTFQVRDRNGATRDVILTSADVSAAAVMNVKAITTAAGTVGYIQFNNHQAPAEQALIDAINTLKAANSGNGVNELVLDIRYNGGGFLDVASELAYMIAGPAVTAGQTFEKIEFNDQHPSTDPVTGQALQPTPFLSKTQGFSAPAGTALPTLNLSRVFVLTGEGTCSASESIINGLRGVDVAVIQIGSTTCGKPYGFYPADDCGTTYFSIQFRGVNAKDFGDYTDGFSPSNTIGTVGEPVEGCSVADDFTQELADPNEARLAAALSYQLAPGCPAPTGAGPPNRVQSQSVRPGASAAALRRPFWRENRIIRR